MIYTTKLTRDICVETHGSWDYIEKFKYAHPGKITGSIHYS